VMNARRIAVLEMADSAWVRLCTPWKQWGACTVGLPNDAEVVQTKRDDMRGIWRVAIRSAEFDEVPEFQEPPVLPDALFSSHMCDAPGPGQPRRDGA